MIITNKLNMPDAFVKAIQNSRHNADKCLSATTLLKGTKEIILTDRHFDEITIDASDEVWAVFGTAVHEILEHQEDEAFKEESFSVPVWEGSEWKITGKVDRYDMKNETIEDWKTAPSYKIKNKEFEDWRMQGLIYAWLLKKSGLNVRHIRFVALLKDFSKTEAKRNPDYPQAPVYIYEYDVNDNWLVDAEMRAHNKAMSVIKNWETKDDEIEPCTPEERWASPEKYAVMKKGRKTAVRVFEVKADAEKFIEELDEKDRENHSIEIRPGVDKKCSNYCACCKFCSYYKSLKASEEENAEA